MFWVRNRPLSQPRWVYWCRNKTLRAQANGQVRLGIKARSADLRTLTNWHSTEGRCDNLSGARRTEVYTE